MLGEVVTSEKPVGDYGKDGPRVARRVRYTIDTWDEGGVPGIAAPDVSGIPPRLGLRNDSLIRHAIRLT